MSADFNPQFSKLGEILVNNGKATESGINEALVQQKTTNEKIGTTLIEMGLLEEDDFTTAYGQQLGYKKADNFILLEADSKVAALIPEDFARERAGGPPVPSHHSPLFKIEPDASVTLGVEASVTALLDLLGS